MRIVNRRTKGELPPVKLPQKTRHMLMPDKEHEDEGSWILVFCKVVAAGVKILRSAHLTQFSPNFHPPINMIVWMECGNGMTSAGTRSGGSQFPPRAATEPDPPVSRRLGRGPPHHDASLGSVPSFPSRQVLPRCPSPRPKNFQNSSTRRPRRKCPRAQTAESEPATNPRSFRGDLLILPGKAHCFEPPSRLFPPFSAL